MPAFVTSFKAFLPDYHVFKGALCSNQSLFVNRKFLCLYFFHEKSWNEDLH